ncbi:hypothetical protein ACFL0P_01120 [Candidatus Omnitrophota bacterium]
MTEFQKLFGAKETHIKETCILLPLLRKDILRQLGVKEFLRGRLYGSGNSNAFTVIHTGVGPAFSGDVALYLSQTRCQNMILFGSCGLVKEKDGLRIGSLVTPSKAYALEGFTEMLLKDKKDWNSFHPDTTLIENFLSSNKDRDIKKTLCATLGSLKLERDYVDLFNKKEVETVDMECSALFSASKHTGKRAMAFFYITDIINKKPFYVALEAEDKKTLSSSIKTAARILCEFIEKNLNC